MVLNISNIFNIYLSQLNGSISYFQINSQLNRNKHIELVVGDGNTIEY